MSLKSTLVLTSTLILMSGSAFAGDDNDVNDPITLIEKSKIVSELNCGHIRELLYYSMSELSGLISLSFITFLKNGSGHLNEYIENKFIERDQKEKALRDIIGKLNFFTNIDDMIIAHNGAMNALYDYENFVNDVYNKVYGTLEGDVARNFEYNRAKIRANCIVRTMNSHCLLIYNIVDIFGDYDIKDIQEAFNKHKSKVIDLKDKIENKDGDYNIHLEEMIKEYYNGIDEHKKIIYVIMANRNE